MAMTKAELAKQLEALQAQYDEMDDEDEEVWIKVDGAEFKLTGAKAKTFLNKHRSHWEEMAEEVDEVPNEIEAKTSKPARKTTAKKTTAPRKVAKPASEELEEELDEINDIIEEEAEEVQTRRFF